MPAFRYRAVDEDGKEHSGTMQETSSRRVAAILSEQGLQVSTVEEVNPSSALPLMQSRLSWNDLSLFNEQLLAVVNSGMPLSPALRALAKDVRGRRLRSVFYAVQEDLDRGVPLSEAVERRGSAFSPVYVSIIRAGERAGNLSGVLSHLTQYSASMVDLRSRFFEAATYPLLVALAAIAVAGYLLVGVVPKYAEIFSDFGAALPWMTTATIGFSRQVSAHWLFFTIFFCAAALCAGLMVQSSLYTFSLGGFLDRIKLNVWVFGRIYFSSSMARFSRTLGLLLQSRVPPVESLELASAVTGNAVLRDAALDAAQRVNGGETIADALEWTEEFDHTFCWLVATSEKRGVIEEALHSMADSYDRIATRLGKGILLMTAPVTFILLALLLGSIIISMYLPLISLVDSIAGL
ncbi:MAG: type II secretion system F family protein [bacterium]|nr:type II secretion system F family protein [bacterium]